MYISREAIAEAESNKLSAVDTPNANKHSRDKKDIIVGA